MFRTKFAAGLWAILARCRSEITLVPAGTCTRPPLMNEMTSGPLLKQDMAPVPTSIAQNEPAGAACAAGAPTAGTATTAVTTTAFQIRFITSVLSAASTLLWQTDMSAHHGCVAKRDRTARRTPGPDPEMRLNLINTFVPNVDEVRPTLSDKRVRHSPARPSQAAPPKSDLERNVPERTAAVDARSCRSSDLRRGTPRL